MKHFIYLLITASVLISACKTNPTNGGASTTITDKTKGTTLEKPALSTNPIVAKVMGRGTKIIMSDTDLKKMIYDYIEGASDLNSFNIISYTEGVYYLGANGKKDGEKAIFAFELTTTENGFEFEKMNKPWYACKKTKCDGCAFQPNAQGQIMRCACEGVEINPCKFQSGIRSNF